MKKFFIRAFFMMLALCTVAGCMTGCQTDGNSENGSTKSDTAAPATPVKPAVVTLNGVALTDYSIVYAMTESQIEAEIADQIRILFQNAFKIRLKVRGESSMSPQRAIVVGSLEKAAITNETLSIRDGEWCLTADADRVYLLSKTRYGYQKALEALKKTTEASIASRTVTVAENQMKESFEDKQMNVMTFNIRNWDKSEGHLYRLKQMLKAYTPDVIGFQEMSNRAGYEWVRKLLADPEISTLYGYIGEDRKDSTGEQCAIFYRKDKFTAVESGTRWLYCTHGIKCTSTDCKGETYAGRFEGITYSSSEHFRIMTYARLKRLSDGKEILFINTHLETLGQTYQGVERQIKQIDYVLNFAKDLTDKGESVVLMGDFNTTLEGTACQKTLNAGFVSAEKASQYFVGKELEGNEKYLSENKNMTCKIDHIFVKSPNCVFDTYTYCDQKIEYDGVEDYASDHIPRIAHLIMD